MANYNKTKYLSHDKIINEEQIVNKSPNDNQTVTSSWLWCVTYTYGVTHMFVLLPLRSARHVMNSGILPLTVFMMLKLTLRYLLSVLDYILIDLKEDVVYSWYSNGYLLCIYAV